MRLAFVLQFHSKPLQTERWILTSRNWELRSYQRSPISSPRLHACASRKKHHDPGLLIEFSDQRLEFTPVEELGISNPLRRGANRSNRLPEPAPEPAPRLTLFRSVLDAPPLHCGLSKLNWHCVAGEWSKLRRRPSGIIGSVSAWRLCINPEVFLTRNALTGDLVFGQAKGLLHTRNRSNYPH